jgi:serine/threonine-protein kinase RsbW
MSAESGNIFERRFPNQFGDLSRVTEEARRFLEQRGVGGRGLYVANLTLEELGTNTLKYGYEDRGPHEILLRLEVQPNSLLLLLEDDGHEFDPLKAPAPALDRPLEEREPGGLGLHLIRQMTEQMNYERRAGRNRVTARIRL